MLEDAIQYYHELLTPEVAEEADALMRTRLKEKNLYFGERPLCVVLRPHFYQEHSWHFIKTGLETLLAAFWRLNTALLADAELRQQLHLEDYENELIEFDNPTVPPWTSSRLDTFFLPEKGTLKVVEYNAETPAGIGYGDVLCDVFDELEPLKRFQEKYNTRHVRSLGTLTDALIAGYRLWGGMKEKPQIGILDWREVPTLNEHEITREYFEQQGYRSQLADPRNLEYRDGALYSDDFRIDLIYKRVLYSELVKVMGTDTAVLRAMRDGNVYVTNSISAKMLAKKASLAMLSDERNTHIYTSKQQKAISEFIPWTRYIEERKTEYNGETVDLLEFVSNNKDRFALKPNDDYGGSGVVLGWQASQDGWEATLQNALEQPYVVQEKVEVTQFDFPMWLNNEVDISPRYVDADPYIFGGVSVDGVLTRLSPMALLNVTAGGGSVVPAVIISEK